MYYGIRYRSHSNLLAESVEKDYSMSLITLITPLTSHIVPTFMDVADFFASTVCLSTKFVHFLPRTRPFGFVLDLVLLCMTSTTRIVLGPYV